MSSQSEENSLGSEIDYVHDVVDKNDVNEAVDFDETDDALETFDVFEHGDEADDADDADEAGDANEADDADETYDVDKVNQVAEEDEIDSISTIKKLLEKVLDEVSNEESFDQAGDGGNLASPSSASQKTRIVSNTSRYAKPTTRGRRPPAVPRGDRVSMPTERRNSRPFALVPRRGGMTPKNPRGEAEDGSSLFISNWGFRSNLIDQNGNFQRATTDLKNYIVSYKSKYLFFFDLVNGRYPQYVRTLPDKMEIWRMSFNVYASGFSEFISHLGEVHCFYQMEPVEGELRWVYKDFNFYPNRMRYGFRVNTFDIADVHSRFIKFICVRDNIIKQFPYAEIHHKVFIGKKFDINVRNMMNRLTQVKRELDL